VRGRCVPVESSVGEKEAAIEELRQKLIIMNENNSISQVSLNLN